ncbi:MAG TPA: ABC transporter permease [Chloroflexota bacterium]|jgi:peptide/nickel transport system permease protein|nr:ABC transporter permease [Chloroflexota bacterium]
MLHYLAQRLVGALSVLFVVSVVSFGLYALTPGDPAVVLLEASGIHSPPREAVEAKRAELHLGDPLPVQYLSWVAGALHGDFGRSFRSYTPVTDLYLSRIGATALLAAVSTLLSVLVALPLGVLAAYQRGRIADRIAQIIVALGGSVPGFWIGLLLILLFAVQLHLLPAFGSPTPQGIVLPAIVLAVANIAVLTRLTRASVLDVLGQEFVTVARAKGLAERAVTVRHVLRNTYVPMLTVLGLVFANLMVGTAVVEYVFAWPGIGRLAVDSALLRDQPVVVGFTVAAGLIFTVMNLLVDVGIAALDPRVRSA